MEKYKFKLKIKENSFHLDSGMVPISVRKMIAHEIIEGRFNGTIIVDREGRIDGGKENKEES